MSNSTKALPKTVSDWQGTMQPRPTVRGNVCDHREDLCLTLIQQGKDRFAVIYGLQIKVDMCWIDAAKEYGTCLMHGLAAGAEIYNEDCEVTP